jgi:hypothetical protein
MLPGSKLNIISEKQAGPIQLELLWIKAVPLPRE